MMTGTTSRGTPLAGVVLTAQFAIMLAGALMFVGRGGTGDGPTRASTTYLVVERGLIMTAVVVTAVGLLVLVARPTMQSPLAWLGAAGFAAAAVVLVVAESNGLVTEHTSYPTIVGYVVLAFASQAVLGGALVRLDVFAPWVGWMTVAWNLGWLAVLSLTSPGDIYFPVLHHVMPLVIGGAVLAGRADAAGAGFTR